ncbi:hypothetical protein [uncultured Polaribacter sp.]|uniref:hypothetical protein n=1 Tax=uncultured Polaribacter sp. TaxID=174711 RepID=UPI002612D04A|nr:hypothetical protein [uncultured Polaribacter sp.]
MSIKKNKILSRFFFILLASFFILYACKSEIADNSDKFKKGVFEIPAGKGYSKTIVTRIDSLQIEEYEKITSISKNGITTEKRVKHIDTLYIKWKNNFFYSLKMKSPEKVLDRDAIFVQITKITDDSYEFSAKIGFSKFATDGTIYKIK